MAKKYGKEYIEKCNKQIWEILNDTAEYDDWTQICLSVQNAVQAAANTWGIGNPEQQAQMVRFINELVVANVLPNLTSFNIAFSKKIEQ